MPESIVTNEIKEKLEAELRRSEPGFRYIKDISIVAGNEKTTTYKVVFAEVVIGVKGVDVTYIYRPT